MNSNRERVTDQEFLLEDIKINGFQSNLDDFADRRFAIHIGRDDVAKIIAHPSYRWSDKTRELCAVWHNKVTPRRLRGLRKLCKLGVLEAVWVGLGDGSVNDQGVGRGRVYRLPRTDPIAPSDESRKE